MSFHLVTCIPSYLPFVGGAEIGMHTLLSTCQMQSGDRFSVVVSTRDHSLPRYEVLDGVEVHRFSAPRRWANWYAPTAAWLLHAPNIVRRLEPDLVLLTYALPSGLGGALGSWMAGVPYVMSLGGNDVNDPVHAPPGALQRIGGAVARRACHVICWSSAVKELVAENWQVERSKMTVLPFGIDTNRFVPLPEYQRNDARRRWSIPTDSLVVTAVQRLERRKGVDVLLEAVAQMTQHTEVIVLIAGTGREEGDLRERSAALGLDEIVRFVGFVDDSQKAELMALADLFVLASRHEGQGIVLAEAAAAGTPSVATNAGGTTDMVQHGQTGLLCKPEDAGALAGALTEALSDRERLREWGRIARTWAESEMALESTAGRFLDILSAWRPAK